MSRTTVDKKTDDIIDEHDFMKKDVQRYINKKRKQKKLKKQIQSTQINIRHHNLMLTTKNYSSQQYRKKYNIATTSYNKRKNNKYYDFEIELKKKGIDKQCKSMIEQELKLKEIATWNNCLHTISPSLEQKIRIYQKIWKKCHTKYGALKKIPGRLPNNPDEDIKSGKNWQKKWIK